MLKKKIKVLYLGFSPSLGGIEVFSLNLIKNTCNNVNYTILKTSVDKVAFEDELINLGCNIISLPNRNKNYIKYLFELKKVFLLDYDYVYYNAMSFSWFEPLLFARLLKLKLIIHSHTTSFKNDVGFKTKFLHLVGKFCLVKCEFLKFACGNDAGKFMFKSNFIVINNGIDIAKFKYNIDNRVNVRKEFGLTKNDIIIGQIARLEKQKNPMFLLEIINELVSLDNRFKLIVIGEGSLLDEMNLYIKKNHLDNNVFLLGKRLDAYRFYSSFDYFVMPSIYEGLSISIVEAQTNGLQCITSANVDFESDITGNVSFLKLEDGAKEWAKFISNLNIYHDENAYKKLPDKFNSSKSYNIIYEKMKNEMEK